MKKTFFYAGVLSCCLGNTFADNYYSGAYLFVGAGIIDNTFTFNQNATIENNSVTTTANNSSGGDEISFNGAIGGGYRFDITPTINLGVEFDANFENSQITASDFVRNDSNLTVSNQIQTKLSESFALLFKPGMTFNSQKTLMYLLAGPQWGDFSSNSSAVFIDASGTDKSAGIMSSSSSSTYQMGWTFGAGVEEYIDDNFHVGIEYQYTDYGTVYSPNTTGTVTANGSGTGSMTGSASTDAHTNSFLIKVVKQFR